MGRVTKFLQASGQQSAEPPRGRADMVLDRPDHDLERVITSWPTLPKHIQRAILTLVNAGKTGRTE